MHIIKTPSYKSGHINFYITVSVLCSITVFIKLDGIRI